MKCSPLLLQRWLSPMLWDRTPQPGFPNPSKVSTNNLRGQRFSPEVPTKWCNPCQAGLRQAVTTDVQRFGYSLPEFRNHTLVCKERHSLWVHTSRQGHGCLTLHGQIQLERNQNAAPSRARQHKQGLNSCWKCAGHRQGKHSKVTYSTHL